MSISMTKPFLPLDREAVATLPGHMGVYELGDGAGDIIFVGYAGGRSLFGLRGEIGAHLEQGEAAVYRYEVTTAYLTRYQELLMVHVAKHGRLPAGNHAADMPRLGRLSIGQEG